MKQIYLLRFLAAKLQLFLLIRNTFPPFSSKYLIIIDLYQTTCLEFIATTPIIEITTPSFNDDFFVF